MNKVLKFFYDKQCKNRIDKKFLIKNLYTLRKGKAKNSEIVYYATDFYVKMIPDNQQNFALDNVKIEFNKPYIKVIGLPFQILRDKIYKITLLFDVEKYKRIDKDKGTYELELPKDFFSFSTIKINARRLYEPKKLDYEKVRRKLIEQAKKEYYSHKSRH